MKHSYYLHFKNLLRNTANQTTKRDKPYRREVLNNELDAYIREMDVLLLRDNISEKLFNLYSAWLTNYVIDRHER
jgi:spore coat protein CotF